jgi:hypothetical protein
MDRSRDLRTGRQEAPPTVDRALRALPAAAATSAVVELPVAAVSTLLPEPLAAVCWGMAAMLAAIAVLSIPTVATAPETSARLRSALASTAARRSDALLAAVLVGGGVVVGTLPALLLWLVGLGPFGLYLTALAFVATGSRLALALPALVLRELSPGEALELSWDLVDGVAVEVGALFAVAVLVALGPPLGAAILATALELPAIVTALLVVAILAWTGPVLPLVFGQALDHLERRRRAIDPHFGRA